MQISLQVWRSPPCLWKCSCNKPPHPSILKRCTISITHLSLGLIPSFSPRPALVSPPGNSSHGSWRVGYMTHGIIRNGKTWDPNTHLCACATSGGIWSHCTVVFKESVRRFSPAELSFTISSTVEILHVAYLYIYLIYYANYLSTYLDMTPLSAQDDTKRSDFLTVDQPHTHPAFLNGEISSFWDKQEAKII